MRRFLVLCLALLIPLAACSDDATGPGPDVAGNYTLQTVAGAALPATVFQVGADRLEVTAGQVVLNADNTQSATITFRETEGGVTTTDAQTISGTYLLTANGGIVLKDANGDELWGTINGNTLTLTAFGMAFVFRK